MKSIVKSMTWWRGWEGVPAAPLERCVYCGFTFGSDFGPLRRSIKKSHRSWCKAAA